MVLVYLIHERVYVNVDSQFAHDVCDVLTWQYTVLAYVIYPEGISIFLIYVTERCVTADKVDKTLPVNAVSWNIYIFKYFKSRITKTVMKWKKTARIGRIYRSFLKIPETIDNQSK